MRAFRTAALLSALLTFAHVQARAADSEPASMRVAFHIEAQPLTEALNQFSRQTGVQVLHRDLPNGAEPHTASVEGMLSMNEALDRMLADTGWTYEFVNERTIRIAPKSSAATSMSVHSQSILRLAQASQESRKSADVTAGTTSAAQQPTSARSEASTANEGNSEKLQEIVVTGTHIRGVAPRSSPLSVYERKAIEESGASSVQDFLRTVPSVFGGGSTEYSSFGFPDDSSSQFNYGSASGVNLRGLGSGATLVLLNGNRLAPSSGLGDFVDVSMIPVSALERVEILKDGASATYGGDAVAGVANFILRRDFDGLESSARYGIDSGSSMSEYQFNSTYGHNWRSGNILFSYDFLHKDELSGDERSYTANSLLPNSLLPRQQRHSLLASLSQHISPVTSIHTDVLYGRREAISHSHTEITSPSFSDDSVTKQIAISSDVDHELSDNWLLSGSASYSRVEMNRDRSGGFVNERNTRSSEWDANFKATGNLIDFPGGPAKLAIGTHHRQEKLSSIFSDESTPFETVADVGRTVNAGFAELFVPIVGSVNTMPGVRRLELNLAYRYEKYSDFGHNGSPKAGILWAPVDGINLRASYGKSFKPPVLGRVGATDLSGSAYTNDLINQFFSFPVEVPDSSVGLIFFGTGEHLQPERSRSWTAGFDIDRKTELGRAQLSATYFDIRFRDRIDIPVVSNGAFNVRNIFLSNPGSLPPGLVIDHPTAEQVNSAIADAQREEGFRDFFGVYSGPQSVGWIVNFVTGNRAEASTRGIDLDATLTMAVASGTLGLSASGTYLIDFEKRNSSASDPIDVIDTPYNPIAFKGRVGATYSRGGVRGGIFGNYVAHYTDNRQTPTIPVHSWTTIDADIRYSLPSESAFSGLELSLNVLNLFNENPPALTANELSGILTYDPANASPVGRFTAFTVTKRW